MYVDMNKQKGSFALTGSQAFELMKGVSETLAGRMAIVELKGLSFREIHHIEFIEEVCRNFKMKKLIGKDTTLLM